MADGAERLRSRLLTLVCVAAACSADPPDRGEPSPERADPRARDVPEAGARAPAGACSRSPRPRRLWKLTPAQFSNTVRTLVPALPDAGRELHKTLPRAEGGFTNEPSRNDMSPPHFDQLFEIAETVSNEAVKLSPPCLANADVACVRGFLEVFGARAFRRPLEPDELTRYVTFFEREAMATDRTGALAQIIRAMVLSPHFLYRSELGSPGSNGRFELTPHERAAALSYTLSDGPPDAELSAAARAGQLRTKAEVEAHARRLLASRENARGLAAFFRDYLSSDNVVGRTKDAQLFPSWSGALATALAAEPAAFVEHTLWSGGRFATLFTADLTVGAKELAAHYGATGDTTLRLPAGQRAGLLTQAGWLASLATETESDVILRGKFVRERFLCQALPPPPPTVNAVPPQPDGVQTQRERLARHTSDPTCAGCHRLMDPVGLLFEKYDAVGRFRTTELGKPIDASGLLALPDREMPLADAVALGKVLGALPEAQRCFVTKVDTYVNGEPPDDAGGACRSQELLARFARSSGDVLDMFLATVTADDFFLRAP